jgi:hypothetical protein
MGKKIMRKGYGGSKKIHSTVARSTVVAANAARSPLDKLAGVHAAWKAGQNPWLTVDNRTNDPKNNKPFIRVRSNDHWGKPTAGYSMGKQPEGASA